MVIRISYVYFHIFRGRTLRVTREYFLSFFQWGKKILKIQRINLSLSFLNLLKCSVHPWSVIQKISGMIATITKLFYESLVRAL